MRRSLPAVLSGVVLLAAGCSDSVVPKIPVSQDNAVAIRGELERGAGGGGQTSEAAIVPTGWKTIVGRFRVEGTPPQPEKLRIDKDVAVCTRSGDLFSLDIQVGSDGGLGNVLLYMDTRSYIPGDPNWEHPDFIAQANATLTGDAAFDQINCQFVSHVFAMRSSQSVQILNSDPTGHNTNIAGGGGAKPINQTIEQGGTMTYAPGGEAKLPFEVTCSIHPWMKSYMIVRDSPYFAVTARDGSFVIPNVPAGEGVEVEFRLWHERVGFLKNVTLNGEAQALKQGKIAFSLTPAANPDDQQQLDFVINADELK